MIMPNCIWYYGKTGTGKSHRALNNMTVTSHYIVPNDNGWWDNYEGQETIVFNDFRGGLPFSDLLQLCDKYLIMLNEEIGTLTLFLLKT